MPRLRKADAGIREGDVLASIDGREVAKAEQAAEPLGQERTGGHLVRVLRGDGAVFVVIPNPPGEG